MIEIKNLSKVFQTSDGKVDALKNISLTIEDGDIYGIIGMSGAGKSTLVRCINMLERPTEGSVLIDKKNIGELSPKELRSIRREITMIFQGFNLLMQKTCLKNIMFPLKLAGVKTEEAKKKALELLEIVGLPDKANAYPAQLSGGQQQRIAIARALATQPKVLLCDPYAAAEDFDCEIEMPLDDFMVAWDNVALLMRQRKSSTPPQGRTRCSAWIRPVGTDAPGVYRLYLNGEEHPLPDDFCAQGGVLAYSLPDEHPHATTAHRQFSYVEPTQGGILLEHGDTPRKYTVYAIGTDGRMIVGDVTV